MRLNEAMKDRSYTIDAIETGEEGMREFLFTLGCYPGENITVISRLSSQYVVNVKDSRYSIDEHLASAIRVCG